RPPDRVARYTARRNTGRAVLRNYGAAVDIAGVGVDPQPGYRQAEGGAMKPLVSVMRRLVIILMLVAVVAFGGVLGLSKVGIDVLPPRQMRQFHTVVAYGGMQARRVKAFVVSKYESYSHKEEAAHHEQSKILVTSPKAEDIETSDSFVCQIR